jgi:hypothetical protein
VQLDYTFNFNSDGSYQLNTRLHQIFNKNVLVQVNQRPTYSSTFSDMVMPTDNLYVDPNGNAHPTNQANKEVYEYQNSNGACWNETVQAAAGVLTAVHGGSCQHHGQGTLTVK